MVGAGRIFGLVPALDGEPYIAQLEAVTDTRSVFARRQAFLDELDSHPEVAANLMIQLARPVRQTERWLVGTL